MLPPSTTTGPAASSLRAACRRGVSRVKAANGSHATASRVLGDQAGSTAPVFLAFLAVHVTAGRTAIITGQP